MLIGEIIKYYREKLNLTQTEVVEGICTISFLSKIERGKIIYTGEILDLISERLGIDLNEVLGLIEKTDKLLKNWHTSIINRDIHQIDLLKKKLENIPLTYKSQFKTQYDLLQARYFFYQQEFNRFLETIQSLEMNFKELSIYDQNLFLHLKGMYYLYKSKSLDNEDNKNAILTLKQINIEVYKNEEVHYHLAVAYHNNHNSLLAYIYANKALSFFKSTNCYLPAIDSETLILLQYGMERDYNFTELVERYKKLIDACDVLKAKNNKSILLHNLGIEYFKRKNFILASKYYKESLEITEKSSKEYLIRLFNYAESCTNGQILTKSNLLNIIRNGHLLAIKFSSQLYILLFNLLKHKLEKNTQKYYSYLKKIVSFALKINHVQYAKQYGNKLYKYYKETLQFQKATNLLIAMNFN